MAARAAAAPLTTLLRPAAPVGLWDGLEAAALPTPAEADPAAAVVVPAAAVVESAAAVVSAAVVVAGASEVVLALTSARAV